jgi:TfoX/Sxy family transcriptional regulator of competence genes
MSGHRSAAAGRREMPAFTKPPPELAERFANTVGALPDVEQRKMFGMPAAFVAGQMFTGLFGAEWFLRLGDADREEFGRLGGTPFEIMPGRAMGGYLRVPEQIRDDERALNQWLERSLSYARALPPKTAKARVSTRASASAAHSAKGTRKGR